MKEELTKHLLDVIYVYCELNIERNIKKSKWAKSFLNENKSKNESPLLSHASELNCSI